MKYAIKILLMSLIAAFIIGVMASFLPSLFRYYVNNRVENALEEKQRELRERELRQDSLLNIQKQKLQEQSKEISWLEDTHRNDVEHKKKLQQKISELRIYWNDSKQELADSIESIQFLRERNSALERQATESKLQHSKLQRRNRELKHTSATYAFRINQLQDQLDAFASKVAQYDELRRTLLLQRMGYAAIALLTSLIYLYARLQG